MVKSERLADTTVLLVTLFPSYTADRLLFHFLIAFINKLTVSVMAAKCFSVHKAEDGQSRTCVIRH